MEMLELDEDVLRQYQPNECGPDGYPPEWHRTVKHAVREHAGHRCERCLHPYPLDIATTWPRGEWTPCDELCVHTDGDTADLTEMDGVPLIKARWRILTVHHLDGDKANLRWWNLAALCQRCHLVIQGRVKMHQVYPFEHSEWMKPHAAGYYAWHYLRLELTRDETMQRLEELLKLERIDG